MSRNLQKDLPLDKPVAFDFTPSKNGQMIYVCGMGMISGSLIVE